MKKVLAICDHCCHSGFARVAHQIMGYLAKDYEVHVLGVNYLGDPHDKPYKVYPAQVSYGEGGGVKVGDVLGMQSLVPRVKEIRPDIVFLFNDYPVLNGYLDRLEEAKINRPVITYFPVDSQPVHPYLSRPLKRATVNVTYTEWGRKVLDGLEVEVIPHGVDTKVFFPQDREEIRKKFEIDPDLFVVLRVDRNSPRKNWFATFRVFQSLYQKKPNSRLMCHTVFQDVGGNLHNYRDLLGFPEDIVWETTLNKNGRSVTWENPMRGIPDKSLALLYNLADCCLTTTTGEGWGLSTTEAQACGIPVIGTNYSSLTELLGKGRGVPVRVQAYTTGKYGNDFALIDEADAARALRRVYADRAEDVAKRGLAFAQSLDWEKVLPRWGEIFAKVK